MTPIHENRVLQFGVVPDKSASVYRFFPYYGRLGTWQRTGHNFRFADHPGVSNPDGPPACLEFFCHDHVHRVLSGNVFRAFIAERGHVNSTKEILSTAHEHWTKREMYFVDEPCAEILLNRCHTAPNPHILVMPATRPSLAPRATAGLSPQEHGARRRKAGIQ